MTKGNVFPQGDNPKDPLKKTGPEAEQELLRRFGQMSSGFPNDVVIGAAINLLVNAVRQTYPTQQAASSRYDELLGKFKSILLGHYDSVTGKRKSIFPFHQSISPSLFEDRDKIHRH